MNFFTIFSASISTSLILIFHEWKSESGSATDTTRRTKFYRITKIVHRGIGTDLKFGGWGAEIDMQVISDHIF